LKKIKKTVIKTSGNHKKKTSGNHKKKTSGNHKKKTSGNHKENTIEALPYNITPR